MYDPYNIKPLHQPHRWGYVSPPTQYLPKWTSWIPTMGAVRGPVVRHCASFELACEATRDLVIEHHVVWC